MIDSFLHLLDSSIGVLMVGLGFFIALLMIAAAMSIIVYVFKQLKIFPFNE